MKIGEILSAANQEIKPGVVEMLKEAGKAHAFSGACRATEHLDQMALDALVLQLKLDSLGGQFISRRVSPEVEQKPLFEPDLPAAIQPKLF